METPVHIDFQGMEPKEKLHAAIARHVAELEKRFGRITACRVVLKGPGQHHRTGGLFECPDGDERDGAFGADVRFHRGARPCLGSGRKRGQHRRLAAMRAAF